MKISPLGSGGTMSGAVEGKGISPDARTRAIAVASGQEIPETSGDTQVDKIQSTKRIKMNTQQSTNRHETQEVLPEVITETPTPDAIEPAQEDEVTKPLSPQFAALARQKRALQVKERELADREEALKTQVPAGNEDLLAKLKASPLSVLQEAGVTYDQLTEAILNSQSAPIDPQKLRDEIKEDLMKEFSNQFSTRDQQAEQQVLNDIKREAIQLTAQGEQFEAIREARQQQAVVDLVHRTWKQSGEVLDVAEAAELVENQLIEEALPFAKLSKVQSRLAPTQPAQAPQLATPKPGTKIMRTLTNRDSASPVMDKRARAIAAMQGTLKRG